MAELRTGDVLGGVRIDAVTGRGGMGIVYRGTELALKRTVALKLVREDLAGNAEFRARFTRESEIAASLDHAHVVPIFAAGEDQGRLFVTMRFVDGTDLREEIKRRGGLDPYYVATVVSQIASALDAAHRRGLVHRDVKPANILLAQSDGRPHAYLTDFGVSRAAESDGLTQAGAMVGTDDYMAPEQFDNKGVDGRVDVYALGCVLYEMLTGHVPFERDSMAAKIYAHLRQPPPQLPAHLPFALNRVIGRAMAKSLTERYTTAGELGRDVLDAVTNPGDSGVGQRTELVERPGQSGHQTVVAHGEDRTVPRVLPTIPSGPPSYPGGSPSYPGGSPSYPGGSPSYPGGSPPPQAAVSPSSPSWPISHPPGPPSYPPGPSAVPVKRSKKGLIIALVGVLVVVAASLGGWLLLRDGGSAPATPPLQALGSLDADPIKVGKTPYDMTEGGGFVWSTNTGDGTISKIDPDTGSAEQFSVGGNPQYLAVDNDQVWVWNFSDAVTRVDIATGKATEFNTGPAPITGFTVGGGFVWLSHTAENTVTRLDVETGAVVGDPIPVGAAPVALDFGQSLAFVVNGGDRTITAIGTDGKVVGQPLKLDKEPGGVRVKDGTIYVGTGDSVTPIDEASFAVGEPISLKGGSYFYPQKDGVYALFPLTGELKFLDLKGQESRGTAVSGIGKGTAGMAELDGILYIADGPEDTVVRVKLRS